jgi:hypothetical protein
VKAWIRISGEYSLAKVGIITLVDKPNGGSIDELESELLIALEGTELIKTWTIDKVTVLDAGEVLPVFKPLQ